MAFGLVGPAQGWNPRQHRARGTAAVAEQPVEPLLPLLELPRPGRLLQALQLDLFPRQGHPRLRWTPAPPPEVPLAPPLRQNCSKPANVRG